jgi:hypothetical protein
MPSPPKWTVSFADAAVWANSTAEIGFWLEITHCPQKTTSRGKP